MPTLIDPPDQRVLLDGTLTWLRANASFFDPPQEDELLDIAPEDIRPERSRKAFGELGLALRLAKQCESIADHENLRWLSRTWVETAGRRRIFFDMRRRIHLVPLLAVACACLAAHGQPVDEAVSSLQNVLDRRFIDRSESSAWNKVDLKYYLDLAGVRHEFPSDEMLARTSTLSRLPALPWATNYDLYGLTHLVFHLSDFGRRDLAPLLGEPVDGIREYAGIALAICLARQDWDLTAELLITRLCLGVRCDPLDREAVRALVANQHAEGFMPGREWMASAIPEGDTSALFFDVYHPTLLVLFLICSDLAIQ